MAPYSPDEPLAHRTANAENKPGHKKLVSYNLPAWVRHPLIKQPLKVAIVFPGEQNHAVGMLQDAKRKPAVKAMLDAATRVFGWDVEALMASGPVDKMAQTGCNQPLMYVAGCAAYELLKEQHPSVAENPQAVAGLSVGEYVALYAAGVITYETGLALIKVRAEAMQALSEEEEMEALVIQGLDTIKVDNLCNKAMKADVGDDPMVYIARHFCPEGFVCAGRKSTVLKLEELAKRDKTKEVRLLKDHIHAGHTPMAQKASERVALALDKHLAAMKPPQCELYLNSTGWRVPPGRAPQEFMSALKEQLTSPLMWESCVDQMFKWGITKFYECGPGRSISFMLANFEFYNEAPFEVVKPTVVSVSV